MSSNRSCEEEAQLLAQAVTIRSCSSAETRSRPKSQSRTAWRRQLLLRSMV